MKLLCVMGRSDITFGRQDAVKCPVSVHKLAWQADFPTHEQGRSLESVFWTASAACLTLGNSEVDPAAASRQVLDRMSGLVKVTKPLDSVGLPFKSCGSCNDL